MKSIALSVIIFSILLSGLLVFAPSGTSADGKFQSNSNNQLAAGCCQGKRSNVNVSGIIDLADLSALVSYLTGGGYALPCPDAANVNGQGIVDLADLSALVSYLTGGGYVLQDCPITTVTDIDGNVYRTVTIGTRVWMAENLRVTHYRNGQSLEAARDPNDGAILNVTDGPSWAGLTAGAYCDYDNDTNNAATYGRLYNWYAVTDSRNIAPAGWHVPTDAEWQTLIDSLGGDAVAGGKMKEIGFAHWQSPNTGATNESGFSLLPGGWRAGNGDFCGLGQCAYYWSSTEDFSDFAWYRYLGYEYSEVGRSHANKALGLSVYCVRDAYTVPVLSSAAVSVVTQTTAQGGGIITSEGIAAVTARGVCWSTSPTPTLADSKTTDGAGAGSFTSSMTGLTAGTLYYVRAYATNSFGTGYGDTQSFTTAASTVTDIDGHVYQAVTIGTQVWMAENLRVTHYRNGDSIPHVTDNSAWAALTIGAYCEYYNDVNNVATYGRLYNWYAVSDSRNITPAGWHVASNAEWQTLSDFLGGDAVAGGKMKETGTHWSSPNTGATNESGFSALPGGYRYSNGPYGSMSFDASFWSSTEYYSSYAWSRYLNFYYSDLYPFTDYKEGGFSVRCVKDTNTIPVPVLSTAAISAITQTTAQCGGMITSDGGTAVTDRGVCWSTSPTPTVADSKTTDGAGTGSFTSSITELTGNTMYYVRAYATNSVGTGYGAEESFTTSPVLAVLTTSSVTAITQTTAESGGTIASDGGTAVTDRGVCWSTSPTPTVADSKTTDGAGTGSFTSSITGLTASTPYHVRAYATNSAGTGYGSAVSFTTASSSGTVTDIDGNVYQTVTIGTQVWMRENLKATHYRNGDPIPNVTDGTAWAALTTGAYCEYDNDVNNVATYGRLYNWHAVADSRNIAPAGWHVASDAEWQTLSDYLGGEYVSGAKMKEAGTAHWLTPNTGATNESGFSALPGGGRGWEYGACVEMGKRAYFWSSTEYYNSYAWARYLYYYYSTLGGNYCTLEGDGFSVRCVRDYDIYDSDVPVLTTMGVSAITSTTAQCGGTITSGGGSPVTVRGVCWSTNPTPTVADSKTTDGSGTGSFTSSITGLTTSTPYYVRAYATNSAGTGYGSVVSFTTAFSSGTVTDIDGNVYQTVTIGTQVWMKENLKATHYRNGDPIPNVTDGTAWAGLTTGAYCDYNNDVNYVATYGRLYNWYAVSDSRDIAPTGWHVPTDVEWQTLSDFLGGDAVAGGKMKEAGTTHWLSPNTGATNESGFTGLPGGERFIDGDYYAMDGYSLFWSSMEIGSGLAWSCRLDYDNSEVLHSGANEPCGLSIRCVKDPEPNTVTDVDGNVYQTVTIGTQVWMAENLKVTHYRNGDPIPNVTNNSAWLALTTGAYCEYNNSVAHVATYGRLYNWYAAVDSRSIAPAGWHVPTDDEWQTLSDYLGGDAVVGGKLKESGKTHWNSPNTGATNESGFSALPGGCRYNHSGAYYDMGDYAYFWSSTESFSYSAYDRGLYCYSSALLRSFRKEGDGLSVRCVRDY